MLQIVIIRGVALLAGLIVGGVVWLAGGPRWAVIGFGTNAGFTAYLRLIRDR